MVCRSPSIGSSRGFASKRPRPNSIPSPTPAAQDAPVAIDEKETANIRELVEQIDAHAELEEMEATSIPTVQELLGEDPHFPPTDQPEATDPARPSS